MNLPIPALAAAVLLFLGPVPPAGAAPPNPGFVAKLGYVCPNGTLPGECAAVGAEGASLRWFQLVLTPAAAEPGAKLDPKDLHGARETAAALGLAVALKAYRDPKGTTDPGGDRYDEQIREAAKQILFMERSHVGESGRSLVDVCTAPGCSFPALTRSDVEGAADTIRHAAERIFEAGLGVRAPPPAGRSAAPAVPGWEGVQASGD